MDEAMKRAKKAGESIGIQRGTRHERARCLAWVDWMSDQPLRYIGTGEYMAPVDALVDGIESGEWPPEEGA